MADAPPSLPLYEVPYLRLFPWLRLFRCPGSAAEPKRLILAAMGLLLTQAGWAGLDRVFPAPDSTPPAWWVGAPPGRASRIAATSEGPQMELFSAWDAVDEGKWRSIASQVAEPAWTVTRSFTTAFDPSTPALRFIHATLAALWALVVWGLIGGAIARVAVVDLARGERVGLLEAVRFSGRKAVSLIGTPLVPLTGVVVVGALVAAFGLLYRLPGSVGPVVAGAFAFLPLVGGLVLTLIVVGLAVGWPLMHASVAAEAEDGFDAMSRSYAYVHQRPWHFLAYAAVAVVAGCVGLWFVELFAGLVVHLTAWALAFGGSASTVLSFYGARPLRPPGAATAAHGFWLAVVALLARGWVYSYFWTAATAIYLLLRNNVDGTPWGTIAYQSRPGPLTEALRASAAPVDSPTVPAPHAPELQNAGEATGV